MGKKNRMNSVMVLLLSLPLLVHAQHKNNGYYGKKAILQLDFVGNTPLFNNIFMSDATAFKARSGNLVEGKDLFNYGFRFNAGYAFFRNFAFLMEYGQEFSSAYPEPYQYIYTDFGSNYEVKHEMVDVRTQFFIPKIELATPNALLPLGLSHQLGLGLSYSSVQEKDYTYQTIEYDSWTGYQYYLNHNYSDADLNPIDFNKIRNVRKFVFYYGLNVRTPVNKSLLITYGLKYMLQFGKAENTNLSGDNGNEQYTQMIEQVVARHRSLSIIYLSLGLSYVF